MFRNPENPQFFPLSTHLWTFFSSSGLETIDIIDLFRFRRSFLLFFFFFLAGKTGEKSISLSISHLFKSQTLNSKILINFFIGSSIFLRLKRLQRKVRVITIFAVFVRHFAIEFWSFNFKEIEKICISFKLFKLKITRHKS